MTDEETGEVYETDAEWIAAWEEWARGQYLRKEALPNCRSTIIPVIEYRDQPTHYISYTGYRQEGDSK